MKKEENFYEIIVLAILTIGAAFLFYTANQSPSTATTGTDLTSMDFPKGMLLLLGVLCIVRLFSSMKKILANSSNDSLVPDKKILLTIVAIVVYSVLWNILGFCLSTFLFLNTEAKIINKNVNMKQTFIVSFVGMLVIFLIFGVAFKVYLPEPIFESLI
jgi:hypothetical protein